MPTLLIGLFLAAGVVSVAKVSYDPELNAVPIALNGNRMPIVPVSINGSGPFMFLIDSGSSRTAISTALAGRLGLERIGKANVVAVTGATAIDMVKLTSLTVGALTKHSVPALAVADDRLKSQNVDGLLAQDVLMTHSHTIDYRRLRLVWHFNPELGPARLSDSIAMMRVSGMWQAALPQKQDGTNVVWLVPDSGAQALVLFEANLPASLELSPLPDVTTSTFFGRVMTRAARVRRLRVGPFVHLDEPAVIVQRRPDAADGHGLLPLSGYDSVTFNVEGSFMSISAR